MSMSAEPAILSTSRAAFERVREDIMAVTDDALIPINLDVRTVVATALATARCLPALREPIESLRHLVDTASIWKLEDYAAALLFVHADRLFDAKPSDDLPLLHDEGSKLKAQLFTSALALSAHGLLPNDRVTQLRNPQGYKELAEYLGALGVLFEDAWPAISGKTPVTIAQVNRANELSTQLIRGVGLRDRAEHNVNEAALLRQRAFTLLVRTYDEVRSVVVFLRRKEGDADAIAPSLYAGRSGGQRKVEEEQPARGTEAPTPSKAPVGHPTTPDPL